MSKRRKRGSRGAAQIQTDLLEQRYLDKLREQVTALANQRISVLKSEMKRYLQHHPAFEVTERTHHDGIPQAEINTAGSAKHVGFEFKGVRRYRLMLQETLRKGAGPGPFYIARYSYAILDADNEQRLFRFEYHPDLKEGNDPYSLIHHFHVERAPDQLGRVHFPLWPFIQEDDPHKVLELVLKWCKEELRRIDTSATNATTSRESTA
jgi:hypothetical protein